MSDGADLERYVSSALEQEVGRRDFLRLGATAAGLLGLAACGGSPAVSPGPSAPTGPEFKVGVVLPYSGTYQDLGDSITKGIQLYLSKVGNQAGNRKITLVQEDETTDPQTALSKTRKLVEQDNVDMVAGYVSSAVLLTVRDYLDQNQIPTLVANAGANAISRNRKSPYIYRTSFSNWQPNQPMGRYMVDHGIQRLTLVYSNYAAGAETAAAVKETYTGKIQAEVKPPFPNTSGDFSAFIAQINASKPDAIYVFMSGQDDINFLKQAKQTLDKSIKPFGSGFFVEQDVLRAIGDAAPVGAITGLHWALSLDTKENQDFVAAFQRFAKKTADVFSVQGYDTGRVIVEALNAVKGKTTDKLAFMKAISEVRFKSPRGDFRFDPNSNNVINTIYVRELVNDPKLGLTNKVISSVPNVTDPGPGH